MTRISIIGSGFVGLHVGEAFEKLGHDVIFYDIDVKRLEHISNTHEVTRSMQDAIDFSEISFVCVPTPTTNGKLDLVHVVSACKDMARALRRKEVYHLIVVKSTVLPTTTESVIIPLIEEHSGKTVPSDIGVCVNPEFMTQIHRSWTDNGSFSRDFFSEERIVIGECDERAGDILEELYKPLNKPIFRVGLREAEFIKYAANCALATKISYWNQIFLIAREMGFSHERVQELVNIVALDKRIGKYGSVLGKAFGGRCLPKDLKAFISFSQEACGINPILLRAVNDINELMSKEFGVRE